MVNNERISRLLDGDVALDSKSDYQAAEQQALWGRYQLIGDALRNEMPPVISLDLAARVSAALADEPTVLAPRTSLLQRVRPTVVHLLRSGGQLAIAASVAAVTLLGVRYHQLGQDVTAQPSPVLNTVPVGGIATPVSINYQPVGQPTHTPQPSMLSDDARLAERERINAFLRDHQLQQRLHVAKP